jgi:indolepyruvate ferredoxin oxidoreductase
VQESLAAFEGPSVLIYDQVCATEKRRRRKRGSMAQPTRHVVINEAVCENCGDCSAKSGCIAIEPVETALGRKRRVNPTACNVDLSCLKGFCPSFVTVDGPPAAPDADTTWQTREADLGANLPMPVLPALGVWRGLFAGIGGGGIVTAGAILAMAAHLEGRAVKTLDFTGLAQKNGAVVAHVQIAADEQDLDVVRIPMGTADLMLAADLAVGCSVGVLERNAKTAVVIGNMDLAATAEFKRNALLSIDAERHRRTIEKVTDASRSVWLHGVRLAERLFGNAQAMNTMLLGLAWQRGLVPVSEASILRAVELNGAAVGLNKRAFLWGRILAMKPELVGQILDGVIEGEPKDLDALIADRAAALTAYQSPRYARRYRALVQEVIDRETAVSGKPGPLSRAAAENLHRVMAYKDEYEVARLHAGATYGAKPAFHMSPPLLWRRDKATGQRGKIAIPGAVAMPVFRVLKLGKAVRGTPLDLFGYQAERRWERGLIGQYTADLRTVMAALRPETLDTGVAIAALPDEIRGFGHIKEANRDKAMVRRDVLLARLAHPEAMKVAAE